MIQDNIEFQQALDDLKRSYWSNDRKGMANAYRQMHTIGFTHIDKDLLNRFFEFATFIRKLDIMKPKLAEAVAKVVLNRNNYTRPAKRKTRFQWFASLKNRFVTQ